MTKDIHLLSISHSFVKKINTGLFSILKKKYGFNISMIVPKFHEENKKIIYPDYEECELNLKVIFKDTYFNHLRLKIYKDLLKTINKNKFTHIFLDQDIISLQSLILIIFSFKFKYRIFYFSNENNIILEKNLFKKTIKKSIYKFFYFLFKKKISNIICYTNQIKDNLDYCGYINLTTKIPLGFDKNIFYNEKKQNSSSKFIISYFGTISEKKGVLTLLKALDLIKIENWLFQIDIHHIERIDYFKKIKKYLKKFNKNNKLKLIKPTHNNIAKSMQITHLSIVPSEWNEQYGRVIQEAAACGSIVIGSEIGAIPEILPNKKFLFKPGDVNGLKNKIEEIYNDYKNIKIEFENIERKINEERTLDFQAKLINDLLT